MLTMAFDCGSMFGMSDQLTEPPELTTTEQVESSRKYVTTRSQLTLVGNGLYRHINGTYHACKYQKGKPKWQALQTSDRKLAERKQRDWIAKLDEINVELARMTLGTLIDTYTETRKGKGEKTQKDDKWIKAHVIATWEHGMDIRVADIRASMLDIWLAKQDFKNSTYNKFSGFWGRLFKLAVKDRIISKYENPFDSLDTPWKNPKKTAKKRQIPSIDQFAAIIESVRNERLNRGAAESANFIEFEGQAGLGQAEVAPMTWSRINWTGGKFEAWRAKTKTWFPVPIYPELLPLLERLYQAAHDAQGNAPKPDARIFTILDARKALANACKRLGFPLFTQRELRSFHICKLHRSGIDIKSIAKWQGHQDGGKLLLQTYTEVFCEDDDAYDAIQLAKLKN